MCRGGNVFICSLSSFLSRWTQVSGAGAWGPSCPAAGVGRDRRGQGQGKGTAPEMCHIAGSQCLANHIHLQILLLVHRCQLVMVEIMEGSKFAGFSSHWIAEWLPGLGWGRQLSIPLSYPILKAVGPGKCCLTQNGGLETAPLATLTFFNNNFLMATGVLLNLHPAK